MIEMHTHCLHNVDDGPKAIETAIALLGEMAEQGVGSVILTPHFCPPVFDNSAFIVEFDRLNEYVKANSLNICLYTGNEVYADENVLLRLKEHTIYTLADSRYVLLELPELHFYKSHRQIIYELQRAGYFVVLAHIERCHYFINDLELLKELIDGGCYCQMNGSYVLKHLKQVKKLIDAGYVHFISSDAHDPQLRPPVLRDVKLVLEKLVGMDKTDALLVINPQHILNNKQLKVEHPLSMKKRWLWF